MRQSYMSFWQGRILSVLFETEDGEYSQGHSGNYLPVSVKGQGLRGRVCDVRILSADEKGLRGELI